MGCLHVEPTIAICGPHPALNERVWPLKQRQVRMRGGIHRHRAARPPGQGGQLPGELAVRPTQPVIATSVPMTERTTRSACVSVASTAGTPDQGP